MLRRIRKCLFCRNLPLQPAVETLRKPGGNRFIAQCRGKIVFGNQRAVGAAQIRSQILAVLCRRAEPQIVKLLLNRFLRFIGQLRLPLHGRPLAQNQRAANRGKHIVHNGIIPAFGLAIHLGVQIFGGIVGFVFLHLLHHRKPIAVKIVGKHPVGHGIMLRPQCHAVLVNGAPLNEGKPRRERHLAAALFFFAAGSAKQHSNRHAYAKYAAHGEPPDLFVHGFCLLSVFA